MLPEAKFAINLPLTKRIVIGSAMSFESAHGVSALLIFLTANIAAGINELGISELVLTALTLMTFEDFGFEDLGGPSAGLTARGALGEN